MVGGIGLAVYFLTFAARIFIAVNIAVDGRRRSKAEHDRTG
ncbi:MAG: hypothetical protein ABR518_00070 [Actinomycetota bacterium]